MSNAAAAYGEPYRPRYHFTPAANWMNDPNGLVVHAGEWHLFYQYNPLGDRWGHMSWGHATSPDLVHWTEQPVAIPEAHGVMAWSGSAVVDRENTSGLGAPGTPPLVAVYTGQRPGRQAQHLAFSLTGGRTWAPLAGPVLDPGLAEFRDPKVIWYDAEQKWVVAVARPEERQVSFYGSPDLKRWAHLSDFGPAGAVDGVWECPDLFELPVDGLPGETRWVLVVSLNPGGVAGGSGVQYFVGRFDGTAFAADDLATRWADWGADFYAAQSWSDVPAADGRRVWIGWMNNWRYADRTPTAPWRGAQSLPRALGLRATAGGAATLVQRPVAELDALRGPERVLAPGVVGEGRAPLAEYGVGGDALEVEAEWEPGSAREFGLTVLGGPAGETTVGVDVGAGLVFVDRTRAGGPAVHPEFAARHAGPLPPSAGGRVRLRVFVDRSSVEVFAGAGETVLTDLVFPAPGHGAVGLYAGGGAARLVSLRAWPMRSARG